MFVYYFFLNHFSSRSQSAHTSPVMDRWPHRKLSLVILSHIVKSHNPLQENFVVGICWRKSTLQENRYNHVCTWNYSTESLQCTLKGENILEVNIFKKFLTSVSILILYQKVHDWLKNTGDILEMKVHLISPALDWHILISPVFQDKW